MAPQQLFAMLCTCALQQHVLSYSSAGTAAVFSSGAGSRPDVYSTTCIHLLALHRTAIMKRKACHGSTKIGVQLQLLLLLLMMMMMMMLTSG
jgi:hypothetical protein